MTPSFLQAGSADVLVGGSLGADVGRDREVVERVLDGAGGMAPAGPDLGPAVVARADGDRVVVAATTGVPGRREGVVGEVGAVHAVERAGRGVALELVRREPADRKSTRLNSSH